MYVDHAATRPSARSAGGDAALLAGAGGGRPPKRLPFRESRRGASCCRSRWARTGLVLLVLLLVGCTREPPPPTPTVVLPTPIPTPSQNAAALTGEDTSDVEVAFRTEVQQVVQQARFLSGAPCDHLSDAMKQDTSMVDALENYARLLRTISTQDQALDQPGTPAQVKRMDDAIADLDDKIASCGITRR